MKKDYNGKESLTLGKFREMTKDLDDSTIMFIKLPEDFGGKYDMFLSDWIIENGKLYFAFNEL